MKKILLLLCVLLTFSPIFAYQHTASLDFCASPFGFLRYPSQTVEKKKIGAENRKAFVLGQIGAADTLLVGSKKNADFGLCIWAGIGFGSRDKTCFDKTDLDLDERYSLNNSLKLGPAFNFRFDDSCSLCLVPSFRMDLQADAGYFDGADCSGCAYVFMADLSATLRFFQIKSERLDSGWELGLSVAYGGGFERHLYSIDGDSRSDRLDIDRALSVSISAGYFVNLHSKK